MVYPSLPFWNTWLFTFCSMSFFHVGTTYNLHGMSKDSVLVNSLQLHKTFQSARIADTSCGRWRQTPHIQQLSHQPVKHQRVEGKEKGKVLYKKVRGQSIVIVCGGYRLFVGRILSRRAREIMRTYFINNYL